MRYWTFKHKPGAKGASETWKFIEQAIRLNSALMQYEYGFQDSGMVTQSWRKALEIKEGDIIFLRGDKTIHAYGKVIRPLKKEDVVIAAADMISKNSHTVSGTSYRSDVYNKIIHFSDSTVFYEDLEEGEQEWGQRIDVDGWKYYYNTGIEVDTGEYKSGQNYTPICELKEEYGIKLINSLKNKFMGHELELLQANKNLILTGAPGTGKTFLAKEMALKLIFGKNDEELLSIDEKKQLDRQLNFVQFHPSYDYTDFIEGLRPYKEQGKEMEFKLTNGIFKNICKSAKDNPSLNFVFIIDEINRAEVSKVFGELFYAIDPGYRGVKGK